MVKKTIVQQRSRRMIMKDVENACLEFLNIEKKKDDKITIKDLDFYKFWIFVQWQKEADRIRKKA